MKIDSWSLTFSWPTNSSIRRGRSETFEIVVGLLDGVGDARAAMSFSELPLISAMTGSPPPTAAIGPSDGHSAQRAGDQFFGRFAGDAGEHVLGLGPASSRARAAPSRASSEGFVLSRARARRSARQMGTTLSLSSTTSRSAVRLPIPGTFWNVS